MDWSSVDANTIVAAVAALAGVFVGAIISEVFARRREAAMRAREAADRTRSDALEILDQTQRQVHAHISDAVGRVDGYERSRPASYGGDVYPRAGPWNVGDAAALAAYAAVVRDLLAKPPGSGMSLQDLDPIVDARLKIDRAIDEQRQRVQAGQPLRQLTEAELAALAPVILQL
jgi:hypothetical protein